MNIKGINNSQISKAVTAYQQNAIVKNKEAEISGKIGDKLELSSEAKMLSNNNYENKINEIKAKVENGSYNSKAVLDIVAEKILKEIN